MCLPVGTVVVDPAIVDDQRQAKLLLERRQSFGKQVSRRLIEVGSAAQRIGAFPSAFMSLPVEPAVELNVAQSNVHVPQFVAHAQQRAGIAKLVLEAVVVVGRSVIGPISEIFQAEVGIVGWAPLAGQIGQEAAPSFECTIDAGFDHQRRRLHESRRDRVTVDNYRAAQFVLRSERQRCIHIMGGGRENERVGLVVEKRPGSVAAEPLEAVTAKHGCVGEVMKIARIRRDRRKRLGRLARGHERQIENNDRTTIVDTDSAEARGSIGRGILEFDLPVSAGKVSTGSGSELGNR